MKILKIILQNINSLKSNTPIEIDFESATFKNVGLYAITGATGAGKTTILDAITIALYHQVPRFNNSTTKSLESVVSYNTNTAFTRVVFENNACVYEVYWGISLATANGKKRTNPKEEVRLKDLTNEKIIAEKKREVKLEVERIISLTYNQFLRSVLLAQGEFASFLSAKGAEKAKLLEQISGEEIYKKIGETIQQRKAIEKRKLEDLKLKIDDTNLLSAEVLQQKKEEHQQVIQQLELLETDKINLEKDKFWFVNDKKLQKEKRVIEQEQLQLKEDTTFYTQDLEKLSKDTLAQPFKESLILIDKYHADIHRHQEELQTNKQQLVAAKQDEIIIHKSYVEKETKLKEAEEKYKIWEPKLEKVSVLESKISEVQQQLKVQQEEKKELTDKTKAYEYQIKNHNNKAKQLENKLVPLASFLEENQHIPAIETQFVSWNNLYVTLQEKQKNELTLHKDISTITQVLETLLKEKESVEQKLKDTQKAHLEKQSILHVLQEKIKKQDLKTLLTKKDNEEKELKRWSDFKKIAQQYRFKNAQKQTLKKEVSDLNAECKGLLKTVANFQEKQIVAKQSVEDAELILKQEQQIISLQKERDKLTKGEPCLVCGAKEHPFVEVYKTKTISESEKEFVKRKKVLEELNLSIEKSNILYTEKKTLLKEKEKQITAITEELLVFIEEKRQLKIAVDFELVIEIEAQIQKYESELEKIQKCIKTTEGFIDQKEILIKETTLLLEKVNHLKDTLSTNISHQKNNEERLTQLKLNSKELAIELKEQCNKLKKLMLISGVFIKNELEIGSKLVEIGKIIKKYKIDKEQFNQLKKEISEEQLCLKNTHKSKEDCFDRFQKCSQKIVFLTDDLKQYQHQRGELLPLKYTVQSTRIRLDSFINLAKKEFLEVQQSAIKSKDLLNRFLVKESEGTKNINNIDRTLQDEKNSIKQRIELSVFSDIKEIKSVLLAENVRASLLKIEVNLKDRNQRLSSLFEKNKNDIHHLHQTKKGVFTESEVLSKLEELNSLFSKLTSKKGSLEKEFEYNVKFIENNKKIAVQIQAQEKEFIKWSELLRLIGGSKNAFNTYVQRLTLKSLIDLANIHLYKLNKRYSLQLNNTYADGEELSFKLLDHYQAEQLRLIDTCSGGEKFLISLALALGLSDLASKNVKIDSLFIDEGFGTLDGDSLETVVSTLENLQAQGKIIGVISHVESLKERISTQIQLHKKGQGQSEVLIVS